MKLVTRKCDDWSDMEFLDYWKLRMKSLGIPYVPFTRDYDTIRLCKENGFNSAQIKLMIDYLTSGQAKYPKVKNFYVLSTTYVNFIYQRAFEWKTTGR